MARAHERFSGNRDGSNSDVYPALADIPPDLFGLCVAGVNGAAYGSGDCDTPFSIMSVSKPFVFALVCEVLGAEGARKRLGVNATGLKFNSLEAIERSGDGRTNPMVNSGAIAATSLAPGATVDEQWRFILDGLSQFAGRTLEINAAGFGFRVGWQFPQSGDRPVASRATDGSRSTRPTRSTSILGNARST